MFIVTHMTVCVVECFLHTKPQSGLAFPTTRVKANLRELTLEFWCFSLAVTFMDRRYVHIEYTMKETVAKF